MTKEMQELIDRELNAALESGVVSNVTVNVTAGR